LHEIPFTGSLRSVAGLFRIVKKISLQTNVGGAVREYPTDVGPVDYVLFVDGKPIGVIEAKREEEGDTLGL
jgi:type I restriction enzyme, R subunit